jgi:glycosyltransferase involved in cell wall biosynthesis
MMKIVCIAASFVPSNTANSIQVVKATHALAELGHEVTLLVPGPGQMAWDELKVHYGLRKQFNIRWIHENLAFRRYDFAYKSVRIARQIGPDLIYTWVLQAGLYALWRRLPTILELHDRVTGQLGPWLFRRFCASNTRKRLLTNTEALCRTLMTDFNLDRSAISILVAPNGVELERYQDLPSPPKARKDLDLPVNFTAGYTGHFYAGRGMDLMFELARSLPDTHFLWVGGGPVDVTLWQARLQSENIKNITLTGFVDNAVLPRYQAACEVLMMPYGTRIAGSGGGNSADIASPMKMFEYMAAGRAILSSDLPVIHEVLDEKTAVFCPPNDPAAWKKALLDLKADPIQRKRLGESARSAVAAYSWRARAERALKNFL